MQPVHAAETLKTDLDPQIDLGTGLVPPFFSPANGAEPRSPNDPNQPPNDPNQPGYPPAPPVDDLQEDLTNIKEDLDAFAIAAATAAALASRVPLPPAKALAAVLGGAAAAAFAMARLAQAANYFLNWFDPLIIDFDGDGIDLAGFKSIDLDADGYFETVQWISADDGILVLDLGLDGIIDQAEEFSFGLAGAVGLTDLERLSFFDSNGDGILSALDVKFSDFRVWQDLNQDGISQHEELFTLPQKGIEGIDLTGNPVGAEGEGVVYWFDADGDGLITVSEIYASAAEAPVGARAVRALDGAYVLDSTEASTSSGLLAVYSVALGFNPDGATATLDGPDFIITKDDGAVLKYRVFDGSVGQTFNLTGTGYAGAFGAGGNDVMTASGHGAWLFGQVGNDNLTGGAGSDVLFGGSGKDSLSGGAGNDILHVDTSDNVADISGGSGTDILIVDGAGAVTIDLGQTSVEVAFGGTGNDRLTASTSSQDVKLSGGDGNDVLIGGAGNDLVSGDGGADQMSGGAGDDILQADAADTVSGGAGNDTLIVTSTTGVSINLAAASIETAIGNAGHDALTAAGSSSATTIAGGAGNDTLTGGSANDVLAGDAGNDTLFGGAGIDIARFGGKASDYSITANGTGFQVKDNNLTDGDDGTDQLQGIEKVVFSDTTVHLDELNSAPVATDEFLRLRDNGAGLVLSGEALTQNDADADADRLSVIAISRAEGGDVSITSDGTVLFDPAAAGEGSFGYQVDDGHGGRSWATTTLEVSQALPTDTLFQYQWGLHALNVYDAWDDYTGEGVTVAVVEDGAQVSHPDLSPNFEPGTPDTTASHGTWVSGLIAGARNGTGIIGVAYDATLSIETAPFGILFPNLSDYDVVNCSWSSNLYSIGRGGQSMNDSIQRFAEIGRDGLGTVTLFAAKNEREDGDDTNVNGGQSSRHAIVVAAVDSTGKIADFSSPGASILVAGPGKQIVGPDVLGAGGYSDASAIFGSDYVVADGTSASTPLVAGVIALMLQANPELGWRDVQEILAYTAWNSDPGSSSWSTNGAGNWNGGGLHYSRDFGFGLVDARAAVRLAETWTKSGTSANEVSATADAATGFIIPDNGVGSATLSIANDVRVESVEIKLDISHANVGDLVIELTSPDGTTSILLNRYGVTPGSTTDTGSSLDGFVWTFASKNFWGELSAGQWTLTVRDLATGAVGQVNDWSLTVYGAAASQDDTYIYTVDYSSVTSGNSGRGVLTDTAGHDTINASPIFQDAVLDLRSGATSHLGGGTLTIAAGTVIEDAFLGDGDDRVTGNDVANALSGGRGNDVLEGGAGADRLDGGRGTDTAAYAGSAAAVAVDLQSGAVSGGDAQGDTLVDIESVAGSALADTLTGNLADNTLTGNAGDDLLFGGAGKDTLIGGAGADTLHGDDGDDILAGGAGNDRIEGGAGIDTASFSGRSTDYAISFVAGVMTITGLDGVDQLFGVELIKFLDGTFGADATNRAPTAVSKSFTLTQNQAFALTEVDLLQGALDADGDALTLHSVYASAHGVVTLTSANGVRFQVDARFVGTATFDYVLSDNRGGEARATLTFIVNPTFAFDGTAEVDIFRGLGSSDAVHGADGNDVLDGGFGNDRLFGDAGSDVLAGGVGSDQLDGGAGIDTASYQTAAVAVAVDLGAGSGTAGEAAGDTLTGIENLTGSMYGDTLLGNTLDNELHGLAGNDSLGGAAGADKLRGDEGDDRLSGGAGIDTLSGGAGADVLIGGAGADVLDGGIGIDIASYADAAGTVTIDLASGAKTGVDAAGDTYVGIEGVEGSDFADTLTGSAAADQLLGGRGDDVITGAAGADTVAGGLGNDRLAGGAGNDTYSYAGGDGDDTITEAIDADQTDRLVLGAGLKAADVILTRSATDLDDVTLSFRGQAGSIFLDEQFYNVAYGFGVEQIVFGNGITWSKADLQDAYIARVQTAGSDTIYGFTGSNTFAITALAGDDRIIEGIGSNDTDRLVFGAGLNAADIVVTRSTTDLDDVTLSFRGHAGSIFLDEQFYGFGYGIEQIAFAEGVTWSKVDLQVAYIAQSQTAGNNTIYGFTGSNTFLVTALAGDDRIVEGIGANDTDRLVFGAGLNAADVTLTRVTSDFDDVTLSFRGHVGSIFLDEQFYGFGYGIEQFVFSDGPTWSKADLQAEYIARAQTSGDDTIYGFALADTLRGGEGSDALDGLNGDDVLLGGASDDAIHGSAGSDELTGGTGADNLQGDAGSDTYRYAVGDGDDLIDEGAGLNDTDKLIFGVELNATDVVLARATADRDDITLSFRGHAGSVALDDQFYGSGYGIEQIIFGDGTTWSRADLQAAYFSQSKTADNDTIYGFLEADSFGGGDGNDTLDGLAGADVLLGGAGDDVLRGSAGNDDLTGGLGADDLQGGDNSDTYRYAVGDGDDLIDEGPGLNDTDRLIFGAGLNVSDLVLTRSTTDRDDITLSFRGQAGSVALDDQFYGSGYGIEQIVFGDGTTWSRADLQAAWIAQAQTAGNDTVYGFGGSTTFAVAALAGDDRIVENPDYGAGYIDTLVLGAGLNVADVILTRSTTDLDDITLSFRGHAGSITLDEQFAGSGAGLEQIVFGDGTTWSKANLQAAYLNQAGATGSVTIVGFSSADTIAGGHSNDTLSGGAGNDVLSGNDGNDILNGNDGDDAHFGGAGEDMLYGSLGSDSFDGGSGVDTINFTYYTGVVTIDLTAGSANFADGSAEQILNVENIVAGNGNSTLIGTGGANTLTGGTGNDTITGGDGNDVINGGAGNDAHFGGAGDDTLYGNVGTDSFDGGDGVDTLDLTYYTSSATIDLTAGTVKFADASVEQALSIESVVAGGGNDTLIGNAAANRLTGGAGADVLNGGVGADILTGGADVDTVSYFTGTVGVVIDLAAGTGNGGDAQGDVLLGIENVSGSQGSDTLAGDTGANTLQGWTGNDVLRGGGGADVIEGGIGVDSAMYSESAVGVTIDLTAGTGRGGNAEGDTLSGIENVYGSQGDDTLSGDGGNNGLAGGNGSDVLRGGAGADRMDGGAGVDTASYFTGSVGVVIDLTAGTTSGGDAQGDVLLGIENLSGSQGSDTLSGDAGANTLQGWTGNDVLRGGDGADRLDGGAGGDVLTGGMGADVLTGGVGNDSFAYADATDSTVAAAGKDTILDFTVGDRIDLSKIDADGNAGNGDTAFTFGTGNFTGPGQIRVVIFESNRYGVYLDINGDKAPDSIINVYSDHALVAGDFAL